MQRAREHQLTTNAHQLERLQKFPLALSTASVKAPTLSLYSMPLLTVRFGILAF